MCGTMYDIFIFLLRLLTLKIIVESLFLPPPSFTFLSFPLSLSLHPSPISSDLYVLCVDWLDYPMSPSHCNHLSLPQLPSNYVSFQLHSHVFMFSFQWLNGTVWVWATVNQRKMR